MLPISTGTFEVVITTENVDRYQEVIKLDGWELEHYKNNPVVLWGHDHKQLPIGFATDIEVKDGKMIAKGKFAAHDFAQTVASSTTLVSCVLPPLALSKRSAKEI